MSHTQAGRPFAAPTVVTAVAGSAALRAVAAVGAGLLLASGAALVLWAITPDGGAQASAMLGGGMLAFASAHFIPVSVGDVAVTLHPLLLTGIVVAVIATSVGRARAATDRATEALHAGVFTAVYALGVGAAVSVTTPFGPSATSFGAPLLVAAGTSVVSLACHRSDWRRWWRASAPPWARAGLRGGVVATMAVFAAGAVALVVGLVMSVPDAVSVAELTTHSFGAAVGMALLCLAFLPNAIVAATGYVSGAGFSLGAASFSPLGVTHADLPAIPLLAAAPESASSVALVVLAGPVLAALIAASVIIRAVATRAERLAAAGVAAALAGVFVAGLSALAAGGVSGGAWASTGAPPLLVGGLVAGVTVLVGGVSVAAAGGRQVPWRGAASDRDDTNHDDTNHDDTNHDDTNRDDTNRDDTPGEAASAGLPSDAPGTADGVTGGDGPDAGHVVMADAADRTDGGEGSDDGAVTDHVGDAAATRDPAPTEEFPADAAADTADTADTADAAADVAADVSAGDDQDCDGLAQAG